MSPPRSHLDYLKTVDTPTLSNAIEVLKLRPRHEGFSPIEIRCLFPEFGRMCGYAVTAHVETVSQTEPANRAVFLELYEAVAASLRPAVIAFQEIGAHPQYAAHCGEVMATVFTRLGAVGLVTDCGVRDIPEVRAIGFQYFARGTVASHANFRIVRVGIPIQVCGMVIHPGDLLHGDKHGVTNIPNDLAARIPEGVQTVETMERQIINYSKSKEFTVDGLIELFARLHA